jgi:hypothetical protein
MTAIADLFDCSDRNSEYWTHVSSQAELPLADAAWRPRTLDQLDAFVLDAVGAEGRIGAGLEEIMAVALYENPSSLHEFRLIASLSDKRLYLDLSYIFSRSADPVDSGKTLCGCMPYALTRHSVSFFENLLTAKASGGSAREMRRRAAAATIAKYLNDRGVGEILELYASQTPAARLAILKNWIMPKEVQQNEAKRRGHGAEALLAALLKQAGTTIVPTNKDTNPMGSYDPNISLESFRIVPKVARQTFSSDIVILDSSGMPRVCIMSLVQSSDPGQFGVNKSDEIVTLRRLIDEHNETDPNPLQLWGLVDGVGYSENKAGTVEKMLEYFHYFVQVKSTYKAALKAHELGLTSVKGISFDSTFYSERTKQQMVERYVPSGVQVVRDNLPGARPVSAGKATIWV